MKLVALRVALLVAVAACRGGSAKTHRGSGAPVELVQAPVLPDAGHGSGAITDEIEPNDAADVATPLALGTTVRGKIESKSEAEPDVDRYRIDIDKPGVLNVMVSGVDGQDLVLEIEDGGGTLIAKSDRPGARVKEGVPNLGVTPGRYTAVVRAVAKKKAPARPSRPAKGRRGAPPPPEVPAGPAPVYEISAQLVQPAANAEREPDDDRGTANDLIVGDAAATGFVGWSDDRDVWKLAIETLSAKNAIDIEVSPIEGTALELEIADGIGTQIADRKAPRGAPLVVRGLLPVVPAGGTPFHYLTVRGSPSNPETAYQLRVTAHVVEVDAEVEPDDTLDHAYQIPPDRRVVYATWTPGDVDCFALPVTAGPRAVEVVAKPTQGDPDLSLEIFVDGKSVATANKAGRGAEEKAAAPIPAGSRAVVRVKGADTSANEAKYDLTVNDAE